ncbi:MAG: UDP-2,3-diacylglucosamine diphosphatase LpxI [Deltaproteobacteria bacterium]
MTNKIGLIAGAGEMPFIWAKAARAKGAEIVAVAIAEEARKGLDGIVSQLHSFSVGQVGKIIKTFKDEGIKELVFIGKVNKSLIFKDIKFDLRAITLMARLKDRKDDTIMLAIVDELKKEGIDVIEQTIFLEEMMPGPGILTKRKPTREEMADIEFGMEMAKGIAGLDIGQTVIIKDKAVMAVEAIEGTDEAIKRGGALGRGGIVVVKVAKPDQDLRFDIPTIGMNTLTSIKDANGKVLAIEAEKTFVVDMEDVIKEADRNGVTIVAV